MSEMTHPVAAPASPGQQLADLRAIHALVSELAGLDRVPEPVRNDIELRYDRATPIARQSFDAVASETAAFAAAGLSAIIAGRAINDRPTGGAEHLAHEMERAIKRLDALLR